MSPQIHARSIASCAIALNLLLKWLSAESTSNASDTSIWSRTAYEDLDGHQSPDAALNKGVL